MKYILKQLRRNDITVNEAYDIILKLKQDNHILCEVLDLKKEIIELKQLIINNNESKSK